MEELGLPASFGKPQIKVEEPVAGPSTTTAPATRGGPSGRGDRGVVGGGKRNKKGRGRGGHHEAESTRTEWDKGTAGLASQYDAFNGGVKRSFNSDNARAPLHESLHAQPMAQPSRGRGGGSDGHRGRGRGRGGGSGGGGGGPSDRGRGGFGGPRRQDTFHGPYLKSSMWADPWQDMLKARQAGTA